MDYTMRELNLERCIKYMTEFADFHGYPAGNNVRKHVLELLDAEKEGRLLVLPAAPNSNYYTIERECVDEDGTIQHPNGSDCEWCCKNECDKKMVVIEHRFGNASHILMKERHIGESVFLSREEAENMLKIKYEVM